MARRQPRRTPQSAATRSEREQQMRGARREPALRGVLRLDAQLVMLDLETPVARVATDVARLRGDG